jgi:hypothetical protein
VAAPTTVRISAHTGSGDIDVALKDAGGRLISLSNYRGSATELMIVPLPPGDYRIALIAQTEIRSFEVKLSPSPQINIALVREMQKLSEEERGLLGDLLVRSGYPPFSRPDIAVGSESIRALLAAQEGAAGAVGPGGIGRSVMQALGR